MPDTHTQVNKQTTTLPFGEGRPAEQGCTGDRLLRLHLGVKLLQLTPAMDQAPSGAVTHWSVYVAGPARYLIHIEDASVTDQQLER